MALPYTCLTAPTIANPIVTDITVRSFPPYTSPSSCELDPRIWHRIEKELYLDASEQKAWLYIAIASEEELTAEDLLVVDVRVGEWPGKPSSKDSWESRPGGIWVLRTPFTGKIGMAVTEVDVLFGLDAVDPRPHWTLIQSSLRLSAKPTIPSAKLSVLYGRAKPRPIAPPALRVREDGKFRIVQISDMHMVTGVGVCKDAIDANGENLPESEADPVTPRHT